jgi:DivIVA domain-containing protein
MTLDEVRKVRFPMSRQSGYEVASVDNFLDKVEETIQALTAEIEALKREAARATVNVPPRPYSY